MLDITTIILTYNEEKHIKRCLENVLQFSRKVYVVDSPSNDRTQEICKDYDNVEVIVHKYPGNQAAQFNWFIDNHEINSEWILRLDADEYLSSDAISELKETLPVLPEDVTGIVMKRDVIFMGKRIKHGKLKASKFLRIWRNGQARYENREMDEHVILSSGRSIELKNRFFDENLNGIDEWIKKHLNYAGREANLSIMTNIQSNNIQMRERDNIKSKYYVLPKFWRGFFFFIIRYIFLGGFLDGKQGFLWNFLQCWWYRTLVDIKIEESLKMQANSK